MDQNGQVRVPWYQHWITVLTAFSTLLGLIIALMLQGSQLENLVTQWFHYFLTSENATHDLAFEQKLEELVFSYRPSVDSLSDIFGQTPGKKEEKIGGPTAGLVFHGYSFENKTVLLFFVTSTKDVDKSSTATKKRESSKDDPTPLSETPAAVAIGFKLYPEFIKRIFKSNGINKLDEITIRDLQRIYKGYGAMSGYDLSYDGNFVTIFGAGTTVFHDTDTGAYGAVFFFPKIVGCGSMIAEPESVFRTRFNDKTRQLSWKNYQSPPGVMEFGPPVDKFPMVIDELDCSDLDAKGYLLGWTAYSYTATLCNNCKKSNVSTESDVSTDYSAKVTWQYYLLHYADDSVGYVRRKLQLDKPKE